MLFDALKLMYDLLYNAHSVQFSLLGVNKPWGNCGFVLFKESNVRRLGGCFIDTTAYVSPNISLIDLFGLCVCKSLRFNCFGYQSLNNMFTSKVKYFAGLFVGPWKMICQWMNVDSHNLIATIIALSIRVPFFRHVRQTHKYVLQN